MNRITDRCKNITLPQLRCRVQVQWVEGVKNVIYVCDGFTLFIFVR